jgi:hypothetical protein
VLALVGSVGHEPQRGDDERRFEIEEAPLAHAESEQKQHGVHVDRIERQHTILRARAPGQSERRENDRERHQRLGGED